MAARLQAQGLQILQKQPPSSEVSYLTFLKKNQDNLEELQKGLRIDRHDLDTELVNQPSLYFKVGQFYAEAISVRDKARLDRDKEHAELDRYIRQEAHGNNERVTEAQVLSLIKEDVSYDIAQTRYSELCKVAEIWLALKESFQQRSYAIKDLVQLFVSNYYTDNVGYAERSQSRDRKALDARERLAEARRTQQRG